MKQSNEGYKVKSYSVPVKRYCQMMDLKDEPELIEQYVKWHSREKAWPEIRAGIREVGILEMEIYLIGCRLFMVVEAPLDFDWDTAMKKLATLPRQQEWEDHVAAFQLCKEGSDSAGKWNQMQRIFYLYD